MGVLAHRAQRDVHSQLPAIDNREMFRTSEFELWARNAGLIEEEKFLLPRYLRPDASTLEAGTAGGRILHELAALGFQSLRGFDNVPELIAEARQRDQTGRITFDVEDAVKLSYADGAFDQIIYLQQILCCIADEQARLSALREAHRVLRPGGVALISFLGWEVRSRDPRYLPFIVWLRMLRACSGSRIPMQALPWFKRGVRFNWGVLSDAGPYVYWYRVEEAYRQLADCGFVVQGMGSGRQVREGRLLTSIDEFARAPRSGMYYFVCTK